MSNILPIGFRLGLPLVLGVVLLGTTPRSAEAIGGKHKGYQLIAVPMTQSTQSVGVVQQAAVIQQSQVLMAPVMYGYAVPAAPAAAPSGQGAAAGQAMSGLSVEAAADAAALAGANAAQASQAQPLKGQTPMAGTTSGSVLFNFFTPQAATYYQPQQAFTYQAQAVQVQQMAVMPAAATTQLAVPVQLYLVPGSTHHKAKWFGGY